MDRSRVAIIIPAYNESQSIASVVAAVSPYGIPLVINDGSSDETGVLAKGAGAHVIEHGTNKGYDEALNTGFRNAEKAGMDYAITLDADGQHDHERILEFLEGLKVYDLVLGVRPRPARFAEWIFACITRVWLGLKDPLCGMKGYRMQVYREAGQFDSLGLVGSELAIRSVISGHSVLHVRVLIRKRAGRARFGTALSANLKILRAAIVSVAYFGRQGRL